MPARATPILRDDPKLARIAAALRQAFGRRLASALLFGSRARGEQRAGSDYDVAVFLEGFDPARDSGILENVRDKLGEDPFVLQFWPFDRNGLAQRTTLMFNIRNEGLPLPGLSWPTVIAPPIVPDEESMKPESKELLGSADASLATAQAMLKARFAKPAAREAYQAVLRAARALVFEERNTAPKTHRGTVTLFSDVAIKTGQMDEHVGAALSQGLRVRLDVDYEAVPKTTDQQAADYVRSAADFVAAVKRLMEEKS